MSQNIEHRLVHNITGGYQRFDLFHLNVDRTPYTDEGVTFENHSYHNFLTGKGDSEDIA